MMDTGSMQKQNNMSCNYDCKGSSEELRKEMRLKYVISPTSRENTDLGSEWSEILNATVSLIRTKSERKALDSFMLNETA